jgi:hemerythrin-like domain-containing protein
MTLINIRTKGSRPETESAGPKPERQGVVAPEEMHPVLQVFVEEQRAYLPELQAAEETLLRVQQHGPDADADRALGRFFEFLETVVLPNNRRQEKLLFALVEQRLRERGESGADDLVSAGIERLEAEHVNLIQLSALMLNFFGASGHLRDAPSQRYILEAGIEQGKALIETLRLHIDREETVFFSLAQRLISNEEFEQMKSLMK